MPSFPTPPPLPKPSSCPLLASSTIRRPRSSSLQPIRTICGAFESSLRRRNDSNHVRGERRGRAGRHSDPRRRPGLRAALGREVARSRSFCRSPDAGDRARLGDPGHDAAKEPVPGCVCPLRWPTIVIRTARQILLEQGPCDAHDIFALSADLEVTRYTGGDSFESVESARRFFESYRHIHRREGMARWTALDSRTGEFLGWCGRRRQSDGDVDLGCRYRRSVWGRGLATEVGQACLRVAFERLRLSSVIARAHPENVASLA